MTKMANTIKKIHIKKGLTIPIMGQPQQRIETVKQVKTVALLGSDYPGIIPKLMIAEGDHVKLGQPLFVSKTHPAIRFTSPGSGIVSKIERGVKRVLHTIEINLEGDEQENFQHYKTTEIDSLTAETIRDALLTSGLWSAFRTRPYNKIPVPEEAPYALFITAIDTNPLAANPNIIINQAKQAFTDGIKILSRLCNVKIFICTAIESELDLPEIENIKHVEFDGPHPAGLVGTHIHYLAPVNAKRTVWHLGYQDVIAIGRLFTNGRLDVERIISLAGPVVMNPRLIKTRLGANTNDLINKELDPVACRVISGSILSGHHAAGWAAYLGRYHNQLSVLPDSQRRDFLGWLSPGTDKYSASKVLLSSIFKRRSYWMTTLQNGSPRAMVPIGTYERVMPIDTLPTQLLRALLVHDTESAQGLGALEMDEEDLALCSYVCPSKYDFGPVLRANLDQIEKEG